MQREIIILAATPDTIKLLDQLKEKTGKEHASVLSNALLMFSFLVNECGEHARVVYEKEGKTTMRPLFKKED